MAIFERFITPGLQKRIAVFKRQKDGSYSHTTYRSLTEMSYDDRMEYLLSCGCDEAVK